MKSFIFTIFFGLVYAKGFCGDIFYGGKVVDENNLAIENVVVSLWTDKDSVYIGGTITDINGEFKIIVEEDTPSTLMANCVSYDPQKINATVGYGNIIMLSAGENVLDEVTVTAKPTMKIDNGVFSFYPGSLRKVSQNVVDLISKIPMVEVKNNRFIVLGKENVAIYINGKPSEFNLETTMLYLSMLMPSDIKKIEVIPNQGSSASALSSGGSIINVEIVDQSMGFNGYVSMQPSYHLRRVSPEGNFLVSHASKKLNLTASATYSLSEKLEKKVNSYGYSDGRTVTSDDISSVHSQLASGSIAISYKLTDRSNIGGSASCHVSEYSSHGYINSTETTLDGERSVFSSSSSKKPMKPAYSGGVFYRTDIGSKGSYLWVGASDYYREDDVERMMMADDVVESHVNNNIIYSLTSFSARYNHSFNRLVSLESGVAYYYTSIKNMLENHLGLDNNNEFRYKEYNPNGYVKFSHKINDVFSYRCGLRLESVKVNGNADGDIIPNIGFNKQLDFRNRDVFFCPSLSMTINIPQYSHAIELSISRTLNEPFYNTMNPYPQWISDETYSVGNPHQKIYDTWRYNLIYSANNHWVFNLGYNFSPKSFTEIIYVDNNGYNVNTWGETSGNKNFRVNVEYYSMFFDRWYMRAKATLNWQNVSADISGHNLGINHVCADINILNSISIDKKGRFNLGITCNATSPWAAVTRETGWSGGVGVEFTSKINTAFDMRLSYLQLFSSENMKYSSSYYSYNSRLLGGKSNIVLSVSYRFGRREVKNAPIISSGNRIGE